MQVAFNYNECNKLEKNSFNNILTITIRAAFEFNSTNSSSADIDLAATWQFQEVLFKRRNR